MDEKNLQALERWGAKRILGALVNIPSKGDAATAKAKEFISSYGEFHPLRSSVADVIDAANVFRQGWAAKSEREIATMERFIEMLFMWPWPTEPYSRPAVTLNFTSGKWEPTPRCLVEKLAVQLVRSRKMLHQCERPECGQLFVKDFSRDRYCPFQIRPTCGEAMREKGQLKWAEDNKDKVKARRRKSKSKTKRTQ